MNQKIKPDVSIIVPVYNVSPYIRKCLDTLSNQTYHNLEAILIDDGSTDDSGVICDEYAKRYSNIQVYHKENGGLASARNYGIDRAKGKWLLFIDSDDWCDNDYVEKMIAKDCDGTDAIISSYLMEDENGNVNKKELLKIEGYFFDQLSVACVHAKTIYKYAGIGISQIFSDDCTNGTPWNALYKLDIINRYGLRFDLNAKVGEDVLFNLSYYARINSFSFVNTHGYHYRFVANSITKKVDYSRIEKNMYWMDQTYKHICDHKDIKLLHDAAMYNCVDLCAKLSWQLFNKSIIENDEIKKSRFLMFVSHPMITESFSVVRFKNVYNKTKWIPYMLCRYKCYWLYKWSAYLFNMLKKSHS